MGHTHGWHTNGWLVGRLNGVALLGPILAEVLGDVEDLDVGEAEGLELLEGGGDVRAAFPGAASAVEDDGGGAGEFSDAVGEGIGGGGGAEELRAGDVGFRKKDFGADLEDEGFGGGAVEDGVEVEGFDLDGGGEGEGGAGLGLEGGGCYPAEGHAEERGSKTTKGMGCHGNHLERRELF